MQLTPSRVVLIAFSGALIAAGALGLTRLATEETRASPASPEPPQDETLAARLRRIEERLAALELAESEGPVPVAMPVPDSAPAPGRTPLSPALDTDALHELVRTWIAEEREARQRTEAEIREQEQLEKRESDARLDAHRLALEHDLLEWQENKLAQLILEVETRREELEQSIDPLTTDPEEAEQAFAEHDAWVERRLIEELGPELTKTLFGED